MLKRILVPLDGSDIAQRALPPAVALARQARAELLLLRVPTLAHIIVPGDAGPALLYPEQSLDHSARVAEEYLAAVQASLCQEPGLRMRSLVHRGEAAGVIAETAAAENAGLVVMSSHGYSGVTRWLLGSVAEKVLHAAPCPVLVVRSPEPLRRMLIALDGSPLSEQVLMPAMEIARGLNLPVTLFRATPRVELAKVEWFEAAERGFGWQLERQLSEEAVIYLQDIANAWGKLGLAIDTDVRFEPAAEHILHCAEQCQADLLAMATHGRTGLRRWRYGSVTEKVLHGACRSMLVVRPPSHELN
jgi:nucleotide-binding universal stress UspA family protein